MDEATRLAGLRALGILGTAAEQDFDELTRLAAETIGTPLALISLVDEDSVWFKSRLGTDVAQTPRAFSFCSAAVEGAGSGALVVEDASADPRFSCSMAVVEFGVRFYAGAPVTLADGSVVGTICVLDVEPRRRPEEAHLALLRGLAIAVARMLDLRRELRERRDGERKLVEYARLLQLAEEMAEIGTWRIEPATNDVQLSPTARAIYGLGESDGPPSLAELLATYVVPDRMRIVELLGRAGSSGVGSGTSHDLRLRRFGDGALRDVRVKARVEATPGGRASVFGVFRDVTAEKDAMRRLDERSQASDLQARRMSRLAHTDLLTGLPNRRAFVAAVEQAMATGSGGSLALVDLDHFKSINDRHGHQGGDSVLEAFGQALADVAGPACVVGRIGGDEFGILLKEPGLDGAAAAIAALRRTVEAKPIAMAMGAQLRVTLSAGLAAVRPADDWPSLFARADDALYRAKSEGRDRLACAAA